MQKKTYNIIVIGCQMNKSDSERIAGYLEERDYTYEEDKYKANLVIITTCGIRQTAEDRVYGFCPSIKKKNPNCKIVITGCLANRKDVQKRLSRHVGIWLPIFNLPQFEDLLSKPTASSHSGVTGVELNTEIDPREYFNAVPKYDSKISAFVPIGNGCDNYCTYCVVPYARGREVYRKAEDIIKEVKNLLENGYKEITLIAQNVNSYKSNDINFPKLLKMVNDLEGDFWLRFSTSHPKDISNELIDTLPLCDKLCDHIHLPAQSGDNKILEAMNRRYTVEQYKDLLARIRKNMSGVAITSDVIVGFPGETKEQFNNTVKLFKEASYDMAYVSLFSPRYGTVAAKLPDDVSRTEKKEREAVLLGIVSKSCLQNNQKYVDQTLTVLVEGEGKDGQLRGRTSANKIAKFKSSKTLPELKGQFMKIKINKADALSLEGKEL